MIRSIGCNYNQVFREQYKNVDILLIDDFQFLAGKERTQEELINICNALFQNKKKVIIASNHILKEIDGIDSLLKSKLCESVVVKLEYPDLETRIKIIKRLDETYMVDITMKLITYMAQVEVSSTRGLKGIFNQVVHYGWLVNEEITIDLVKKAILVLGI